MATTSETAALRARFRSLLFLGEGGMGTVEVALEKGEAGVERVVALKRMRAELAKDPRHVQMFLHEARLVALLSHPNVVHTLAFGEAGGELFLAMEYVAGETLLSVLARAKERGKPVPPAIALRILESTCEGLHAAHELKDTKGNPLALVHRDVTPHNVMVSYDGHVKLLDFGVAKVEAAGGLTRTGEVKGKMAYMSPEQAMAEPVDRRSDLYSLGAILYEALAGAKMWGEGTDLEVMRRMAFEPAPKLAAAVQLPENICKIQEMLVARAPDARPKTAREVASLLRRAGEQLGAPVTDADLSAFMRSLFAEDAEAKRTKLLAAMESDDFTASDREAVRESLVPSVAAPPASDAAQELAMVTPPSRAAKRPVAWVLAAAAVLICGLGAGVLAFRGDASPATVASKPDAASAAPPATPSVPLTASATVAAPPLAPPNPIGSAARARPGPRTKPAVPPSSAAAPSASSKTPGTIDVDPNPI